MGAAWLGELPAEPPFLFPFQKSGPVQKGPRYVELVLVADNQEVKWGQTGGLLSQPAARSSKPPWRPLCVSLPQFRKHKDLRSVQNRMKEIVNHVDKVSPGLWSPIPAPGWAQGSWARLGWVGWSQSQPHRELLQGDHIPWHGWISSVRRGREILPCNPWEQIPWPLSGWRGCQRRGGWMPWAMVGFLVALPQVSSVGAAPQPSPAQGERRGLGGNAVSVVTPAPVIYGG